MYFLAKQREPIARTMEPTREQDSRNVLGPSKDHRPCCRVMKYGQYGQVIHVHAVNTAVTNVGCLFRQETCQRTRSAMTRSSQRIGTTSTGLSQDSASNPDSPLHVKPLTERPFVEGQRSHRQPTNFLSVDVFPG
jgi:hypothetical protein